MKQERRKEPEKGSGRASDSGGKTHITMYLWSNYGEGSNFLYSLAKAETTDNSKWLLAIPAQKRGVGGGGSWWVWRVGGVFGRAGPCRSPSLSFPLSLSHYISSPPLSLSPSLTLSPVEFDAAYGIASAHILWAMSTQNFGQEGRKEGLNFLELDFDFYVDDFLQHAER